MDGTAQGKEGEWALPNRSQRATAITRPIRVRCEPHRLVIVPERGDAKRPAIVLVPNNMSGSIDFGEFLKVVEGQKNRAATMGDENDMIDAFAACGGRPDKSGHVKKETIIKIIKHDFGLTIDVEELFNKIDEDGSGEIDFYEFSRMLGK